MTLIEFLEQNGGKPALLTWGEVGDKFNITGNAARKRWARYSHDDAVVKREVIAKTSDKDLHLEGMRKVKTWQNAKGVFLSSYERIPEEEDESLVDKITDSFERILVENYSKDFKIKELVAEKTNKTLVVAISDCHVGSEIDKDCIFPVKYNKDIFAERINQMVEFVITKRKDNGIPFENFVLFDLGDSLDGYSNSTSRGGHHLPQNLDNAEQWEVYVDVLTEAWERIVSSGVAASYNYVGASNSNHSGEGFDYIAMKAVGKLTELAFGVNNFISKQAIDLFPVEAGGKTYSYVYFHGKERSDRRSGMPLNLDSKTREYLQSVIDKWGVEGEIVAIKGDLHQMSSNRSHKGWWYENVPSVLGSSGHSINNYTPTQAAFYFEVLDETGRCKGVVDFK